VEVATIHVTKLHLWMMEEILVGIMILLRMMIVALFVQMKIET
jgi:hypothetical protein